MQVKDYCLLASKTSSRSKKKRRRKERSCRYLGMRELSRQVISNNLATLNINSKKG